MKAAIMFRIASVLIALFALGHTLGFRQVDPQWKINSILESLQKTSFVTQGFTRTYWDFYVGFGLFCSVFLLFTAIVAWSLGGMSPAAIEEARLLAWSLTLAFGLVFVLSWRYFFPVPMIFSAVIFMSLLAGSVLSRTAVR